MSQASPNNSPDYAISNFEWDEMQTAWESHYYNCVACQKLEVDGTLEEAIPGFCTEGQQLASNVVALDKVLSEGAIDVTL